MNIELVSSGASAEINFKTRKIRASRPISLRVAALLVARYVAAIPESELDALEKSLAPS
jgi:hypothetical protein